MEEEEKTQGNRDSPIIFYHEFDLIVAYDGLGCDRRQERESRHPTDGHPMIRRFIAMLAGGRILSSLFLV
jgi:hypothetical protein